MATKAKVTKKKLKTKESKNQKIEKIVEKVVVIKEFEGLLSLKEMLEAGVHFGHSIKRRNPRMDDYVYAVKNGVQIFDLVQTLGSQ